MGVGHSPLSLTGAPWGADTQQRLSPDHAYHFILTDCSCRMPNKANSPQSVTDAPPVTSGAPMRVLIVEDDALVALGIRMTVTELGYEVVGIAASELEAVALADAERPQMALMDIRLRGPVDGVDTARRLRSEFSIRSVYLSAYADEQTMARVAQTYPLGFVQKPYSAPQLKQALELAQRRLVQNTEKSG